MKTQILIGLTVVCSLVAAILCYDLVLTHTRGASGHSWFDAGCSAEMGATFNCKEVLQSPYATIPPRYPDSPSDRAYVPVAFFGLLYYTSLCVWFVGVAAPDRRRAWLHAIPTLVVGLGLVSSAWYVWLMFKEISAWCPWCLATHALNLAIAVCVVALWLTIRRTRSVPAGPAGRQGIVDKADARSIPAGPAADARVKPASPVGATVLMTLVAIFAVNFGFVQMLAAETQRHKADAEVRKNKLYTSQLTAFKNVPEAMVALWEHSEPDKIPLRPDDPTRSYGATETEKQPLHVVVFSDFECPSCHRFAVFFESRAAPQFDGRVLLSFKHYPIDQSCNPRAGATMHPHACEAARMAEAARILAGQDGFWHAHDLLFNRRRELAAGALAPSWLAGQLGLDPQAFEEAMQSQEATDRIVEDAQLAGRLGVTGTPAVFVENRSLTPMLKIDPGFWNSLADRYFERLGISRPSSTVPKSPAVRSEAP